MKPSAAPQGTASPSTTPVIADRAFPSHARLDRYFPSSSAEESRGRLVSCVERGEGPALLVGSAGAGKTMLLEVLSNTFRERFAVAHLAGTQLCTRRALLQSILYSLELPYRDNEEGDLRLALLDYLRDKRSCPAGALLLVDEAHSLAPRLLEELRVLGNLARSGEPLVRLVLAGTTVLEECLAAPEMEAFNQRIAARCYLSPLTYDELVQYVRGHIAAAGANPDELLSGDAAAAVFEATDGIPRLVNQLCDRAIVLGVEAGAELIDRAAIQNAWSDLHQLPAPWHSHEPEMMFDTDLDAGLDTDAQADTPSDAGAEACELTPVPSAAFVPPPAEEVAEPLGAEPLVADTLPSGDWNADAALAEPIIASPTGPRAVEATETESTDDNASVADLFGEDFEEEELLLDPYAGFDNPFPVGTPVVTNRDDSSISSLVATLAPVMDLDEETEIDEPESEDRFDAQPVQEPLPLADQPSMAEPLEAQVADDREEAADLPVVGLPFRRQAAAMDDNPAALVADVDLPSEPDRDPAADEVEPALEVARIDIGNDPAVLLIEDESVAQSLPLVRRQEYRQLFASLRGV